MPIGKDGNGPLGLPIPFLTWRQKHRGHSAKRLRVDGESLVFFIYLARLCEERSPLLLRGDRDKAGCEHKKRRPKNVRTNMCHGIVG